MVATPAGTRDIGRVKRFTGAPWAWAAYGVVTILIGLDLYASLGASLAVTRTTVAVWILITAGFAVWRWWIDSEQPRWVLAIAVAGASIGAIVFYGHTLSLDAIKAAVGLFWILAGAIELIEWRTLPRPILQSPWLCASTIFIGVVTTTFPSQLVVQFTFVAAVWAFVLGGLCVVRALWLAFLSRRGERRDSGLMRAISTGLPAVLLLFPILGYGNLMDNTRAADSQQSRLAAFYEVPPDLAPGVPGSVIRFEPLTVDGIHGRGWRILFRSEDVHGRATVSPGVVFAPADIGSNRTVVAWAHGTVGLGPMCAPSRDPDMLHHIPWVNQALDRGWVVAAADYAGAGGTGVGEKYMVIADQARDVINSVRAARELSSGAGNAYATYGESQGGLISLAAGALGASYASELTLVGIGGVASASDIGSLMQSKWDRPLATWLLGPHLVRAWTREYPNLAASTILTSAANEHYAQIADEGCIFDILGALINPQIGLFLSRDPTADPDWRAAFIANRAPDPPAGVPVFVGHGLADPLIDPSISASLVQRYCTTGATVRTLWMPGVEHIGSSTVAAPTYMDWLGGLVSGGGAPSSCAEPLPVAPAPALN